jgi:hypothetical protein
MNVGDINNIYIEGLQYHRISFMSCN